MGWASCGNFVRSGAHRSRARARAPVRKHPEQEVLTMATKQRRPTEEARRRHPTRKGRAGRHRERDPKPRRDGEGRRAGQGVRHAQCPQRRPAGTEDGRAGEAVLAECELPTPAQPTLGKQKIAQVRALSTHGCRLDRPCTKRGAVIRLGLRCELREELETITSVWRSRLWPSRSPAAGVRRSS